MATERVNRMGKLAGGAMLLLAGLAILLSGCRVVQGVADVPGHTVRAVSGGNKDSNTNDPVVLQQRLFRFADDYSGQMVAALDNLNDYTNLIGETALIRLKLNLVENMTAIVTGPNTTMNLLDAFVLVKLTRTAVEKCWPAALYGKSVQPLLDAAQKGEEQITKMAGSVLKPNQLEELDQAIADWQATHQDLHTAMSARALGLMSETSPNKDQGFTPESVFGLLKIDPFSGLDPATREIAETRLFGERALYLAQRAPFTLRWQMELLTLETSETQPLREFRTNSQQVADALDRTSRVAAELPELVRTEREQILKSLKDQESELTNVALQVQATLHAGRQMSDSLNTTLITFDKLQTKMTAVDTNQAQPSEPAEPFRIQDYAETAQRIDAAAERLTQLLVTFDQTLGSTNLTALSDRLAPSIQQAQSSGKEIVDYAFRKALLLLVVACVLVAGAVWLLRRKRSG